MKKTRFAGRDFFVCEETRKLLSEESECSSCEESCKGKYLQSYKRSDEEVKRFTYQGYKWLKCS